MTPPVAGPLVNVVTATAAKNVRETTPVSIVPFWPQSPVASTHGQLPHHGVNASGVNAVAGSSQTTSQRSFVNIVNTPCAVQFSNTAFPVFINAVCLRQGSSGNVSPVPSS